jgi:hypothetical protein
MSAAAVTGRKSSNRQPSWWAQLARPAAAPNLALGRGTLGRGALGRGTLGRGTLGRGAGAQKPEVAASARNAQAAR